MILVDASAFIAAWARGDANHARAVRGFRKLQDTRRPLVTTNMILWEVIGYWYYMACDNRRPEPVIAYICDRMRHLHAWERLTIIDSSTAVEHDALTEFERFGDNPISLADCVAFTVMRRHGIREAFTFDHHFAVAGFTPWSG